MIPFRLPQHHVSECFWRSVGEVTHNEFYSSSDPRAMLPQNLRYLGQLCVKLQVKSVIEVGSGRSTRAMLGAGVKDLWTCDRQACGRRIDGAVMFEGESTDMLKGLTTQPDMFFFDGRLHPEDFAEIKRLSRPDTWYVFDDFHGLEKGVLNAWGLKSPERYLMVPGQGRSTLAAMAPVSQLSLTIYG